MLKGEKPRKEKEEAAGYRKRERPAQEEGLR